MSRRVEHTKRKRGGALEEIVANGEEGVGEDGEEREGAAARRRRRGRAAAAGGGEAVELHVWEARWPLYGLAWAQSAYPRGDLRLAVSSFLEDRYTNRVMVVDYSRERKEATLRGEWAHGLAPTKLLWRPEDLQAGSTADLLATSGYHVRLWRVPLEGDVAQVRPEAVLHHVGGPEAPDWRKRGAVTSFDWCSSDSNALAATHVDGSLAVWDITKNVAVDQVMAHEGQVYDVAFNQSNQGRFLTTASADGSVRLWDRRNRFERAIVLYESERHGFFRASWSAWNENFVAIVPLNAHTPVIVDMRVPETVAAQLKAHSGPVNALSWSPYPSRSNQLLTAGSDGVVHMWQFDPGLRRDLGPTHEMRIEAEVSNLSWDPQEPYGAITYDRSLAIFPL